MNDALKDSNFKFDGEKILSLPLESQQIILNYINSATNLQPNQKQAINQFLSVGNQYNGALINIGLSNIEKLQNVS